MWDSGSEAERRAAEADTYPDERSPAKGTEPETVAFIDYDGSGMMLVAKESDSGEGLPSTINLFVASH